MFQQDLHFIKKYCYWCVSCKIYNYKKMIKSATGCQKQTPFMNSGFTTANSIYSAKRTNYNESL